MKKMVELGYKIIIITNQYIINEGIITEKNYLEFQTKLINKLYHEDITIYDTFHCPHTSGENCDCMKPRTGLIEKALLKYPSIELSKSFLVGDSLCDALLAEKLDLKYYIVGHKEINIGKQFDRLNSLFDVSGLLDKEDIK